MNTHNNTLTRKFLRFNPLCLKVLLSALIIGLTGALPVQAVTISMNFQGTDATALDAGDATGVYSVGNWNNLSGVGSGMSNLLDSTGATTGVNLTTTNGTANGTWTGNADAYQVMFGGGIGVYQPNGYNAFSLSGLSSLGSDYTVVVYYTGGESWSAGRTGSVTITGTPEFYFSSLNNTNEVTGFVQTTSESSGSPEASNYAMFSGLSSDTLTVTLNNGSDWLRVAGFQVSTSAVPEPETFALVFGVGALALVVRRRR